MALRFVEIHPSPDGETLNQEWVVVENTGKLPFHTRGCAMTVSRRGLTKKNILGVIDPGFLLQPGEKIRMCTGAPGTKAHGEPPPETELKNYFLLLNRSYLDKPGNILTIVLRSLPVGKAEYDASAPSGVKA